MDHQQSYWHWWTSTECTSGTRKANICDAQLPFLLHIGTLHVCSCQQVLFHSEWNAVVSLWGTREAEKPSLKKFISRPGLRQLIQVLEPSSTCTHRARYQLHSGLPYLAATDDLAVALTQVPVLLQFLQSSISQQQSCKAYL